MAYELTTFLFLCISEIIYYSPTVLIISAEKVEKTHCIKYSHCHIIQCATTFGYGTSKHNWNVIGIGK